MIYKKERITPERAREMLLKNNINRPIRRDRVNRLVAQLKAGLFRTTHQGIAFAEDGTLLDGQHRLLAIAESGVTVEMFVMRGADIASFSTIDQHDPRDAKDGIATRCKIANIEVPKNLNSMAALAAVVLFGHKNLSEQNPKGMVSLFGFERRNEIGPFVNATKSISWCRSAPVVAPFAAFDLFHPKAKGRGLQWIKFMAAPDLTDAQKTNPLSSYVRALQSMRRGNARAAIASRTECYLMGVSVINAMVENRPLRKIYTSADEIREVDAGRVTEIETIRGLLELENS